MAISPANDEIVASVPGPGSALISYQGDGHTVYGSGGVACVDDQVNRYLIDRTLPTTPDC